MTRLNRLFFLLPIILPAYIIRFHLGPLPTTLLEICLIAFVIFWMVERKQTGLKEAWERSKSWHWPAGLWLLAGIVGVSVAALNGYGLIPALGLFRAYFVEPLIIFLIGFDLVRTDEERQQLWKSFSIITIALGILAAIQMLTGWGIPHPWDVWPGRRATGPFPFPNALALFVTPIVALAMTRVVHVLNEIKANRGGRRPPLHGVWVDITTIVAGVTAILCAQSDGGLVALAAAIFVALIMHQHSRRFAIELAIVGFLAIALIAPVRDRVIQIATFKDWSGMVRTVMWKETVTLLKDRPVFGAGLAAYPTAILPYHKATWMEVFQYPHNIILNLWSEVGLLGIIAFGWIIITWIRGGRGEYRIYALPVIAALLVHGLVDVPYFKNDLSIAFWLLILLTTSYEKRSNAG